MDQFDQVRQAGWWDHLEEKIPPSSKSLTRLAGEPYKRGYRNPSHLRDLIASSHRTNAAISAMTALTDQIVAIGVLVESAAVVAHLGTNLAGIAVIVLVCPLVMVVVARQLRGLENLVHEASHYNWSRRRRWLNDLLAYALAAIPVGAKLSDYREGHLLHHGRFGTVYDPDRVRYLELGIEETGRTSLLHFGASSLRRLPAYQRGWLHSVRGSPVTGLAPFAWFTLIVSIPSWWRYGPAAGVVATVEWLGALLIALPLLRFVAEGSEHVYTGTDTVFDATVTNLGLLQRLVFHPHNDGYHTVHHLWSGIPHHRVRYVHLQLIRHDTVGYACRLRYRRRVLEDSRVGILTS